MMKGPGGADFKDRCNAGPDLGFCWPLYPLSANLISYSSGPPTCQDEPGTWRWRGSCKWRQNLAP